MTTTITPAEVSKLRAGLVKLIAIQDAEVALLKDELATLRHVICGLEQEKADLTREAEQLGLALAAARQQIKDMSLPLCRGGEGE
jgi:predicted  nucleic acid-binding Zn-ribbon protein